jgi:hypothetical protein
MEDTKMNNMSDISFTEGFEAENFADLMIESLKTVFDLTDDSGMLGAIPFADIFLKGFKTVKDIQNALFLKKISIFFKNMSNSTLQQRSHFIQDLESRGERRRFGETVILLLERAENMEKPEIIGKIMASSIRGEIQYDIAMRICSIVDRCYVQDLEHLKSFKDGVQGVLTPIVESLHAAGVVSNCGFDGGTAEENSSGVVYCINEYGELLVKYGLGVG